MCVTIIIEIFGTHLKFFLENKPAVYGFTGAKTGSTFRFLFLLEHVLSYLPQKTRFGLPDQIIPVLCAMPAGHTHKLLYVIIHDLQ